MPNIGLAKNKHYRLSRALDLKTKFRKAIFETLEKRELFDVSPVYGSASMNLSTNYSPMSDPTRSSAPSAVSNMVSTPSLTSTPTGVTTPAAVNSSVSTPSVAPLNSVATSDQHYHVETRIDPTKSWNNPNNVQKVLPPNYQPGHGTGFLPGEAFPGT